MKYVLTLALVCIFSFSQAQEHETHEYMSLTQKGTRLMISYSSEDFKETSVYKERRRKNKFDFSPLLKRVSELEVEGWEVLNSVGYAAGRSGYPTLHFMMRRKK